MTYLVKINDEDLQALADNEFSPDVAKYLLHLIEHDRSAKKRYEELLKQNALLKSWHEKFR